MKKLCGILTISLLLLLGCTKTAKGEVFSKLDNDGNYIGFKNIPEKYTAEEAVKNRCYVRENSENGY